MRQVSKMLFVATVVAGVGGCGPTYYRVTDPTTHRAYYTTEVRDKGAGSVQLRDAGTGKSVTLQNSEVQKVSKEEYDAGRIRSVVGEPAPNSVPAPRTP